MRRSMGMSFRSERKKCGKRDEPSETSFKKIGIRQELD